MPESDKKSRRSEFIKLFVAMFALPLPFEAAIAFVKREPYDPRRAAILLGTIAVLLIFGLTVWQRSKDSYLQSIIGYYAILIGLILAGSGLAAVFAEDNLSSFIWPEGSATIVTALASTLGFLLIAAGFYLIKERRKQAKVNFEIALPRDLTAVRVSETDRSIALWQTSDQNSRQEQEPLIPIVKAALAVETLHYVAMFDENTEIQFYADLFDERRVGARVRGNNAERRETYAKLGHYLRYLVTRHDTEYPALHSGPVVRLVLDVLQGAIFYYSLSDKGFLVGVTLDQRRVDPADWKMSILANDIRVEMGMTEMEDYYRLCPQCGATNRGGHPHTPQQRPGDGGTVHELRPRDAG